MDDPWGSPWASADPSGSAAPRPTLPAMSVAADGPQLPPPALTSLPSLALPALAEPSPWADDAAATGLGSSAEGFGGFGGFGSANDAFDDSAFGDWATATPTPSGGGGGGGSGGGGSVDHGSSAALGGFRASESPERPQRLSPFTPVRTNSSKAFFTGDASPIAWPSPTASRSPSRSPSRAPTRSPTRSPATSLSAKRAPSLGPIRDEPERTAEAGADTDGDDGDDGDDAVEGDDDSPITSVDEDAAAAPPRVKSIDDKDAPGSLDPRLPLQRKVSVQQLVVHFDGLAATKPASRQLSPSPSRAEKKSEDDDVDGDNDGDDNDDDDEEDDFADFEGPSPAAAADVVRPETPEQRPEEATARTTPAPSPSAASVPSQAPTPVRGGRASAEPPMLSIAALLDHYGPVGPFTPPASTLDALFAAEEQLLGTAPGPRGGEPPAAPALDAYVPDHVLTDSFTAISERRVWYRLARAGSSRRNRAGLDDDNYRPVTWATSTAVRPDTLRIVRRWVEEDAFTGRATLGGGRGGRVLSGGGGGGGGLGRDGGVPSPGDGQGSPGSVGSLGSGRGHLFGWDSTAAPLALDSVYRKKRPKTRPVSMGSNTATATATTAAAAAARVLPGPSSAQAVTAGDWARHALPATRHSVHFTGAQRLGLRGGGLASPLSPASTPASSASEWTLPALHGGANSPAAAAAAAAVLPGAEADDGDDWGEMVSSPVVGSGFGSAAALALGPGPSAPTGPPSLAATSRSQPQPATADADVDRAVEAVLHGLPDLSYMTK